MQVLLRIANGKTNVRKVRLQSDTVIGRSPECQLKVASNQISRRHCQILIRQGFVAIKDLGSANGTFVNGRRVPAEVEIPLTPGTRVMLGPLHFTVDYDPAHPEAVAAPPIEAAVDTVSNASQESVANAAPRLERAAEAVIPTARPIALPGRPLGNPAAKDPEAALSTTASNSLSDTAHMSPPTPEDIQKNAPSDKAKPATPPPVAQPVLAPPPAPAAPAANSPKSGTQPSDHDFHFGIFAASGSGVIVESAPEIPMIRQPVAVVPIKPDKPGKRGFLQMLGWGKKDPAEPTPAPAKSETAPPAPKAAAADPIPDDEIELGPESNHDSFDILVENDSRLESPDAGGPDGDLNRFFNRAK